MFNTFQAIIYGQIIFRVCICHKYNSSEETDLMSSYFDSNNNLVNNYRTSCWHAIIILFNCSTLCLTADVFRETSDYKLLGLVYDQSTSDTTSNTLRDIWMLFTDANRQLS